MSLSPLAAQWGADSQPTRTTADHSKRVVGYVTQWDAWKSTSGRSARETVTKSMRE